MKALGQQTNEYTGLEIITLNDHVDEITLKSDEVVAVCPVTHQMDMYTVSIILQGTKHTIESKTLKLFFASLKDEGIFAENLALRILNEVKSAIEAIETDYRETPTMVFVCTEQKSRGGISIRTVASSNMTPPDATFNDEAKLHAEAFFDAIMNRQSRGRRVDVNLNDETLSPEELEAIIAAGEKDQDARRRAVQDEMPDILANMRVIRNPGSKLQ